MVSNLVHWIVMTSGPTFWGYVEPFPSKKASIDGPGARAEQSKTGGQSCQHDVDPHITVLRKGDPQFRERNQCPGDRRPQTSEQKYSR